MPARSSRCKTILLDQSDTKRKIAEVNPAGRVPVLHDGDFVIWDSLAICEYVARALSDAKLWPDDRAARARARSISAEMHSSFAALRREMPMDICAHKPGRATRPRRSPTRGASRRSGARRSTASGGPFLFGSVHDRRRDVRAGDDAVPTYGVELDATCRSVCRGGRTVAGDASRGSPTPSASRSRATNMATGRIVQLARSDGGVPKLAITEAHAGTLGLEGDRQVHTKIHGGPERALCLFSLDVIQALQAEGHPTSPGSTGENVTIAGLDWASLGTGTRLALGDEVVVELTREAEPCRQIAGSFLGRKFKRLEAPGQMRWYCRVLKPGILRVDMPVSVTARCRSRRRAASSAAA